MPDNDRPAAPAYPDKPLSHAAFLGWALGFMWLIALSVVGIGHSRQIRGDANIQFWIVAALVAAALAALAVALWRSPSAGAGGRIAVGATGVALALYAWETLATGVGYAASPSAIVARALGF